MNKKTKRMLSIVAAILIAASSIFMPGNTNLAAAVGT